jgi:hypothetical protein
MLEAERTPGPSAAGREMNMTEKSAATFNVISRTPSLHEIRLVSDAVFPIVVKKQYFCECTQFPFL